MKRNKLLVFVTVATVFATLAAASQQLPAQVEQQWENRATAEQAEPEEDAYLQQLLRFAKDPLHLNTAGRQELEELGLLNELQIENFISYRRLLGNIVDLYEMQAIPGWDLFTIRRLLPYITINVLIPGKEEWGRRFRSGDHQLVLRAGQALGKQATGFVGGPQRLFFRYRYSYKNLLQYGLLGEKDAGESFFSGAQKAGFDFYSFHLFARKAGLIQSLALGDFTVNMGQGLIQWQSMAFKKSGEVMAIKRQSAVLRPYQSAGEFNFQRGAGISLQKQNWELTVFISLRRLSAGLAQDSSGNAVFSSFNTSGYHRTASEIKNKNHLHQLGWGINLQRNKGRLHTGINYISYRYSLPLQKRDVPYNRFAISGDHWHNLSVDYAYTFRNLHFFGEAAIDYGFHKAWMNGLLISADRRVDLSLLYRSMEKEYQSLYGNAFTENISPSNEKGLYAGISLRPRDGWRLDAYADLYMFPWLKYGVDAPGPGSDFFAQVTYSPDKQTEIITRFRNESKPANQAGSSATRAVVSRPRQNWRLQVRSSISSVLSWRNRVEMVWYDRKTQQKETGFLTCMDIICKPSLKPWSGILRLQYFETGGYNARLYAYENDVQYSYAVPAFFGKGFRYYLLFSYDWKRNVSCSFRWAQTLSEGKSNSEWKMQGELRF